MRLGLLLPPLGDREAGLAVYAREIGSRLLAAHDDWVVFAEDPAPAPAWGRNAAWVSLAAGGGYRLAARAHRRLARLLAVQGRLRREVVRRRVAALLVPYHDGIYRSPVPQAVVVHDLTLLSYPPAGARLARLYMRWLFRRVAQQSAAVVAVSASTARDLGRRWAIPRERLRVVHEGCDRGLFRPFGDDEIGAALARLGVAPPYLFYAGTFARHKNLDTALALLERLAPRFAALTLVVAGPGRDGGRDRFRQQARRRGLAARVRDLGYVERSDLGPLMAGAAAFVFPSRAEGFGLAVLEAMASGAAVLAADRASLPEVVGDGGVLLDPDDAEAWSREVGELLTRPERGRELRRRALARAAAFDWDRAAAEILALLGGLAGGGSSAPGAAGGGRR